jgi:hypothetical protein
MIALMLLRIYFEIAEKCSKLMKTKQIIALFIRSKNKNYVALLQYFVC